MCAVVDLENRFGERLAQFEARLAHFEAAVSTVRPAQLGALISETTDVHKDGLHRPNISANSTDRMMVCHLTLSLPHFKTLLARAAGGALTQYTCAQAIPQSVTAQLCAKASRVVVLYIRTLCCYVTVCAIHVCACTLCSICHGLPTFAEFVFSSVTSGTGRVARILRVLLLPQHFSHILRVC